MQRSSKIVNFFAEYKATGNIETIFRNLITSRKTCQHQTLNFSNLKFSHLPKFSVLCRNFWLPKLPNFTLILSFPRVARCGRTCKSNRIRITKSLDTKINFEKDEKKD